MNKPIHILIKAIPFSNKKQKTSNVHNKNDYQTYYTEQKKSETKEYIHYNFIQKNTNPIYNIRKNNQ